MSGVGAGDVSTMAMSLLAVVGLILGAGYLLRRTPLGAVARQSGPLKIVATLPLGTRERLVLVDARGTELLLAVSPAGVFSVGSPAPGAAASGAASWPGAEAGSGVAAGDVAAKVRAAQDPAQTADARPHAPGSAR